MADFEDAEGVLDLYAQHTEKEISELRKTIVALRAKISLLQNQITKGREKLADERERALNIPIPPSVLAQIASLNDLVETQKKEIEYYKIYVQPSVIINRISKEAPTRSGGLR